MAADTNDFPRRRSHRHHVVPRSYLRAWADEDDFVGVLDVQTRERKRLPISNVAVRSDANTFEMIDVGPSDEWEVEIGEIENLAAPILRSIVVDETWPLDDEPRGIVANFIALQTARAPWLRRSMNETSTEVARMMQSIIAAQPDDQLRATAREATGEELDDEELASPRPDGAWRCHGNASQQ
jgi:hypothetical protein